MALKTLRPRLRDIERRIKPAERAGGSFRSFYSSRRWRLFAAGVVSRRGRRCEACGHGSVGLIACDHVVPLECGGAPFDERNIQVLCQPCHQRKTAEDASKLRAGELRESIHPDLLAFMRGDSVSTDADPWIA